MKDKGLGYNIHALFGDDDKSVAAIQASLGKDIVSLELIAEGDGALHIGFADDTMLSVRDDARSCCESRYMTTDDTLADFVGTALVSFEIKDVPDILTEYETHEVQFLVVTTSKGAFTMETHNVHNGYYGGFWLVARLKGEYDF